MKTVKSFLKTFRKCFSLKKSSSEMTTFVSLQERLNFLKTPTAASITALVSSARFRKVSVAKSSLTVALVTFVFSVADQCRQPVKKKRGISITDNLHVK